MSVELMTKVWQMKLNHTDKLVLLALADNANDESICWPSIATIARKTCLSIRGVQAAMARLNDDKHLKVTFRKKGSKNNQSNLYRLTLPPLQDMHPPLPHAVHPLPHTVHPPSRTPCTQNHQLEPSKKQLGKNEEVCEEEVLPAKWHTYAENRGIPDEQIYLSWKRFKEITEYPFSARNWRGWIDKERIIKKKHL